jgi:hypothetical protein
MKSTILLLFIYISHVILAQNCSYITYVKVSKKKLIENNFYKKFKKVMNDSCFFEYIETAEIKNINRLKNNLPPIYLQEDRTNILKFEYFDFSDKPTYINDSVGTNIVYKAYKNRVKLEKSDTVKFLLKFGLEDSIITCQLLGMKFIFNQKNEEKKETPVKILYYHWNDLSLNKTMLNFNISFNFDNQNLDFVSIEKSIIGYQSFLYEGYFSFDYFQKGTLEKFIFLEKLNRIYIQPYFDISISTNNSKLKVSISPAPCAQCH